MVDVLSVNDLQKLVASATGRMPWYAAKGGNDVDGKTPATAKLLVADALALMVAATGNEELIVGAGTFDASGLGGNNDLTQCVFPKLRGVGKDQTVISCPTPTVSVIVCDNAIIEDLTVIQSYIATELISNPIAIAGNYDRQRTIIRNVSVKGLTDGINCGGPSSGHSQIIDIYDCDITSSWDTINAVQGDSASHLTINVYNTRIDGLSQLTDYAANCGNFISTGSDVLEVNYFNCVLNSINGGAHVSKGVIADGANVTVRLYNTRILTDNTAHTSLDIEVLNDAKVYVDPLCVYNPARCSGTILKMPAQIYPMKQIGV